ncbi:ATP-dependent RNA helicase eIF4A isoform X1 [Andrographis paniculata]|uniref:ATP-dependent RNA helicase eIF4A isoform X1 n=2 Tax=Andrographis paniculata TaxID=175694 RepID=UPI0021E72E92|nr:ATP-dependent RNA helicase eIF4A isoform X1 [Andrographis paniculata]XP_051140904.1 ATP-dependent RNA helicase eIF4A isoform X1 [Andrographis paniculata]XP_051140905.1 ATP-dependent RNA helicase eIF4A isoform X1 [Andrographis paniculata]XP_051140906.1 ATP-dependent RNA helicase eIF4A isoform X1 [Andrographis paniculata]XP_051140909.1 ATP-dependent RNA helicase eIF4A isoform X1 [Andrographis paniculata]
MDAAESPLSTSPSTPSSFSPQRHFYLAVDRLQFKMETLMDLLGMAGQRPCLPMVVCCSSRDELDAVCSNVSNLSSYISISSLYSDLPEADRARILDDFRQAIVRWNRLGREKLDSESEKEEDRKSHLIVVTDACLPLLGSSEAPVSARILINYELPTKKETYMRRMATCLSSDGLVINMVVGGEVVILKSLEESSGMVIAEMPIHIFEMM